jgi:uncharacterized membrane-anchored protein YhcB (DUF1043 family)
MKLNKDNFFLGIILLLILVLIFGAWYFSLKQKKLYNQIHESNRLIIEMDKTVKEDDGQYSKLVNYFNTEKDLNNQLKEQNKSLYNLIKKQDEKLLMINNTVISLKNEVSEGFGNFNKIDTNLIDLKLKYPNEDDNFITWNGTINKNTTFYSGEWTFGKLPLQIILTETDRGMWKSRLIGPDWLLVDSMEINSLPFPTIDKPKNFSTLVGGGYVKSFNTSNTDAISVGFGLKFKNHNLILNGTTNKTIGFNYYYNVINFK